MTHVDYDLRSPLLQPFIERLGRQLKVVRSDERGCGLSTADDVPLSLDTAVEEIEGSYLGVPLQRATIVMSSRLCICWRAQLGRLPPGLSNASRPSHFNVIVHV